MFSVFVGILLLIVGGIELFGPGWQILGEHSFIFALEPNVRWTIAVGATLVGFALIVNAWRIYLDEELSSWTYYETTEEAENDGGSIFPPSFYRICLALLVIGVGSLGIFIDHWIILSASDRAEQNLFFRDKQIIISVALGIIGTGIGLLLNGLRRLWVQKHSYSPFVETGPESSKRSFLLKSLGALRFGVGFLILVISSLELFGPGWAYLLPSSISHQTYRSVSWFFALLLCLGGFLLITRAWRVSFLIVKRSEDRNFEYKDFDKATAVEVSREVGTSGFFYAILGLCLLEIGCLDLFGPGWPNIFAQSLSFNIYHTTAWFFALLLALSGFNLVFSAWNKSSPLVAARGFYDFELLEIKAARFGAYLSVALRFTFGLLFIEVGMLELYQPGWNALVPDFFFEFLQKIPVATGSAAALVITGFGLLINALRLASLVPEKSPVSKDSKFHTLTTEMSAEAMRGSLTQSHQEAPSTTANFVGLESEQLSLSRKHWGSSDNDMNLSKLSNYEDLFNPSEEKIKTSRWGSTKSTKNSPFSLKADGRTVVQFVRMKLSGIVSYVKALLEKRQDLENEVGEETFQNLAKGSSELTSVFSRCRGALLAVVIFSALINVFTLTGSFYVLEVYARVIPGHSVVTLVVLSVLALMLMVFHGVLDFIRSRILIRASNVFEDGLGLRIFDITTRMASTFVYRGSSFQPIRELDAIKAFLCSRGPSALMDLPWLPFYIAIIFMFHWVLGLTAMIGAIFLVSLAVIVEIKSHKLIKKTNEIIAERLELALESRRNAEVLASLGMQGRLAKRYQRVGLKLAEFQTRSNDISEGLSSISRTASMVVQSAIVGVGALIVIAEETSFGIIIAGSILCSRALSLIDQGIANWKLFIEARYGWKRLLEAFEKLPEEPQRISLPEPKDILKVENLLVLDPAGHRAIIHDINFELKAGQSLCIIGPSGAGKSTLARSLVRASVPAAGHVSMDGISLDEWSSEHLGNHLGYLPQDVELFSGTIAENIARLSDQIESEAVIAAAQAAGAHQLILTFKDGYQTEIGVGGTFLSAGHRQRIALARALYKNPFLVILDEPNSNLDADGDKALLSAVERIKKRNGIIIAISHRPGVLKVFDFLMIMAEGRIVSFGPRDEILARYSPQRFQKSGSVSGSGPVSGLGGGSPPKPQLVKDQNFSTVGEGE